MTLCVRPPIVPVCLLVLRALRTRPIWRNDGFMKTPGRVRNSVTAAGCCLLVALSATAAFAIPHFFTTASLNGRYTARFAPAKSFSADAPGDPGGVASAPRQNVLKVGLIDFNGAGGAAGRMVATT